MDVVSRRGSYLCIEITAAVADLLQQRVLPMVLRQTARWKLHAYTRHRKISLLRYVWTSYTRRVYDLWEQRIS
jgi:hypothetical protein